MHQRNGQHVFIHVACLDAAILLMCACVCVCVCAPALVSDAWVNGHWLAQHHQKIRGCLFVHGTLFRVVLKGNKRNTNRVPIASPKPQESGIACLTSSIRGPEMMLSRTQTYTHTHTHTYTRTNTYKTRRAHTHRHNPNNTRTQHTHKDKHPAHF